MLLANFQIHLPVRYFKNSYLLELVRRNVVSSFSAFDQLCLPGSLAAHCR
jgi:hypothetical protein